jgi:hypothetical protein
MYLVAGLMRLYSPLLSKNNDNAESFDDELTLLNLIIMALTIIGSAIMLGISVANLFPSHLVSNRVQSVCNSSSNGKEGVMNAAIVDETVNANTPHRHRRCEEGTTEHSVKSVGRFNSADEEMESLHKVEMILERKKHLRFFRLSVDPSAQYANQVFSVFSTLEERVRNEMRK